MSSGARSSAPGKPAAEGLPTPRRHWAVAVLLAGLIITVLDGSMTNVALPSIAQALELESAAIVRVVLAYNLMVLVTMLPLSALAERVGFRRIFGLGSLLCAVASLGAALADTLPQLMAARLLQGLGSAMLMGLFGGMLRNIYPLHKLAGGISLNAMMVGLMSVLGPTIGAFILELGSWRWIYLVNLPICALLLAGVRLLPDPPHSRNRYDWLSAGLNMALFGALMLGMDALAHAPLLGLALLALTVGIGWLVVRRSLGQPAPVLPVDLLRRSTIAYAVGASIFSFATQMSAFVALPFYFQQVMNYSYAEVGVLLGAWAVGMGCTAPLAGYLANRHPVSVLCGIGAGLMALSLGWLLALPVGTHLGWLLAALLLGGLGFGLFQSPNNRAILGAAPRQRSGAAGGLQATTRVLGQGMGTAMVAIAFTLSQAHAPTLGVCVSIACALIAMAINIARYLDPAKDPES